MRKTYSKGSNIPYVVISKKHKLVSINIYDSKIELQDAFIEDDGNVYRIRSQYKNIFLYKESPNDTFYIWNIIYMKQGEEKGLFVSMHDLTFSVRDNRVIAKYL